MINLRLSDIIIKFTILPNNFCHSTSFWDRTKIPGYDTICTSATRVQALFELFN